MAYALPRRWHIRRFSIPVWLSVTFPSFQKPAMGTVFVIKAA